jgi:hypothetical protein
LHHVSPLLACRHAAPRADVMEDLKYQLSNADEGSRPASDLIQNPIAGAYLVVLAMFAGALGYLAFQDSRAAARREASLREMEAAAAEFRAQGMLDEAAAMEEDLVKQRKPKKADAKQPARGLGDFDLDEQGNRFARRQGRAAEEARKAKKARKSRRRRTR